MNTNLTDTPGAVMLRDLQSCAKTALTEKTWMSARIYSVAFSCVAFVVLIMLAVYCAIQTAYNNRTLLEIHTWYKQDREEAKNS